MITAAVTAMRHFHAVYHRSCHAAEMPHSPMRTRICAHAAMLAFSRYAAPRLMSSALLRSSLVSSSVFTPPVISPYAR